MQVPQVSEDDLRAFGKLHFPHTILPATFLYAEEDHADISDDELGYYTDGEKRTLSDVQIAIFRHSEVQALIRKGNMRAMSDIESNDTSHGLQHTTDAEDAQEDHPTSRNSQEQSRLQQQEADVSNNGKRNTQRWKKHARVSASRSQSSPDSASNDRKDPNEFKDAKDSHTYRRRARELDGKLAFTNNVELDYG